MKYVLIITVFAVIAIAIGFVELYTQIGRYQAYWNRRNQQSPLKDELLYVALGDSTAQGIGARKPQEGYVGLIGKELEKVSSRPVRTLNFSKTGARVSDVLERQLSLLEKAKPPEDAVITIEIGANDMGSFEADKFENEMDKLMARLPKQTIISDIPYFGSGIFRAREANVKKANEIMRKLAKRHGFQIADLHERTKKNNGLRTFAIDWFHPSSYGYKTNWAPAFLEKIPRENDQI